MNVLLPGGPGGPWKNNVFQMFAYKIIKFKYRGSCRPGLTVGSLKFTRTVASEATLLTSGGREKRLERIFTRLRWRADGNLCVH